MTMTDVNKSEQINNTTDDTRQFPILASMPPEMMMVVIFYHC